MGVASALLAVPVLYAAAMTAYLLVITFAAFLSSKRGGQTGAPCRIAVAVPAHNESLQIAETVKGLLASDYPADAFTVMVLADNCDDDTAAVASAAGAQVYERHDAERRGKGQALDWLLKTYRDTLETYDVLAVVDADTWVDTQFLAAMAASFAEPETVAVQGRHAAANPETNFRTALTYAGFALINHVRPMGRARLGATAGLNGNGMAFHMPMLLERGWTAHTVVEDVEFGVRLLLDGIKVHYNPDALVTTDMAATRSQAAPQRRRWEAGRLQMARMFVPPLMRAFATQGRGACLDAALDLAVPPLSAFVLLDAALLAVALATGSAWSFMVAACVLGLGLHVCGGLLLSRAPWRVWISLAAAPLFIAWKAPLYLTMLIRPTQKTWERTARQAELAGKNSDDA